MATEDMLLPHKLSFQTRHPLPLTECTDKTVRWKLSLGDERNPTLDGLVETSEVEEKTSHTVN